jgi:hypothetical protein
LVALSSTRFPGASDRGRVADFVPSAPANARAVDVEKANPMKQTKTSKPSKGRSDEPHTLPHIPSLESLEEISALLGTFQERRRIAHTKDQPKLEATMKELETHYRRRRAELS